MPSGVYKRKPHTEETKRKIGIRSKIFHNKPEIKMKSREIALRRWQDPKEREKLSKPCSEEAKANMKGHSGVYIKTEEHRRKLGDAIRGEKNYQYGTHKSQEFKDKVSKALKGKKAWNKNLTKETDERVAKISQSLKGYIPWNKNLKGCQIPSEETKRKMSISHIGMHFTEEHRKNMSEAQKGKNLSKEHRKKISKSMSGENSFNWRGGISFEPYSPEFNRQLKELIRQRDGYQCQLCGMPECENIRKLDVHHIDYNKLNCLPSNLISLCRRCNAKVNYNREYWEEYFRS